MNIVMNGENRDVPDGLTVTGFVDHLGLDRRGLAIERNRAIVAKAKWDSTYLQDDDRLEIVQFVGGGF